MFEEKGKARAPPKKGKGAPPFFGEGGGKKKSGGCESEVRLVPLWGEEKGKRKRKNGARLYEKGEKRTQSWLKKPTLLSTFSTLARLKEGGKKEADRLQCGGGADLAKGKEESGVFLHQSHLLQGREEAERKRRNSLLIVEGGEKARPVPSLSVEEKGGRADCLYTLCDPLRAQNGGGKGRGRPRWRIS